MARQLVPIRKLDPNVHGIPFTPAMLDWIAFHRDYNGAAKAGALIKCGGRIYVDPGKFLDWMATNPRISPPVARIKASPSGSAVPSPADKRRSQSTRGKKPSSETRRGSSVVDSLSAA